MAIDHSVHSCSGALRQFAGAHGRWAVVDGQRLFFVSSGQESGEGMPLVFLHGIPTWSFLWRGVIEETALTNRSVAVDLPGFGLAERTNESPVTVSDIAGVMERFLDIVLPDASGVGLVAHDFGALVGAEMLARDPVRYPGLVIMNTSLRPEGWIGVSPLSLLRFPVIGEMAMAGSRRWMLRLAMHPFVERPERLTADVMEGYWLPFERGFDQHLLRLFRERSVTANHFVRWRAALASYPGRAMLLWGMRDPAFGPRYLRDLTSLLPSAWIKEFAHASHFVPEDRPRAAGRVIRAFVNDQL